MQIFAKILNVLYFLGSPGKGGGSLQIKEHGLYLLACYGITLLKDILANTQFIWTTKYNVSQ